MKKYIIDPDSGKNEKFFSIAILILIIVAVGAFAILRSDADMDLSSLRGEISPEAEEELVEEEDYEEDVEVQEEDGDEADGQDDYDKQEDDQDEEKEEVAVDEEEQEEKEEAPSTEVVEDGPSYRVEVNQGEGLTHVARRALEAHLQTRGSGMSENLTAEHKVYIEDYIQRRLNHSTGWLEVGETLEVSENLINEAIESAEQLTEHQLENLTQYTI